MAKDWISFPYVSKLSDIQSSTWNGIAKDYPGTEIYVIRRSPNFTAGISNIEVLTAVIAKEPGRTNSTASDLEPTSRPFRLFIVEVDNIFGKSIEWSST